MGGGGGGGGTANPGGCGLSTKGVAARGGLGENAPPVPLVSSGLRNIPVT